MSLSHKKWTSEEDSTLIAQVKATPQNLNQAFIKTAELTGRTKGACSNRWYTNLSKSPDIHNVCFAIFSKERYGVNRKNLKKASTVANNRTVWSKIINFIRNI